MPGRSGAALLGRRSRGEEFTAVVAARPAIRRYLLPAPWTDPNLGIPVPDRHQLRLAAGSRRCERPESRPRRHKDDQTHRPWERGLEEGIVGFDGNERYSDEEEQDRAAQRAVPRRSFAAREAAHRPEE